MRRISILPKSATSSTTTQLIYCCRFASAGASFFDQAAKQKPVVEQKETTKTTSSTQQQQQPKRRRPKSFTQMFDETKVAFASAASTELVPTVAASEAYDLAATALRTATGDQDLIPNFCFTVISVDHEGMIDAPQVVWRNFSQDIDTDKNPVTNPQEAEKLKNRLMLGSIVRNQRVGDGFVEVLLGYIPDLKYTQFTFDKVPTSLQEALMSREGGTAAAGNVDKNNNKKSGEQENNKNIKAKQVVTAPPCVAGFILSDWRIGARHPVALADRINATEKIIRDFNASLVVKKNNDGEVNVIPAAPLVGAVLPPAEDPFAHLRAQAKEADKSTTTKNKKQQSTLPPNEEEIAPSLFFINDDVYRGSAGAVTIHSNLIRSHVSTLTPPVFIKEKVSIDEGSIDEPTAVWTIKKLGGKVACDFIREVYETDEGLKKRRLSKLFLGLSHPKLQIPFPLSFVGFPDEGGHISIVLPAFLRDAAFAAKDLTLLRDDEQLESQLIGQDLLQFEKQNLQLPISEDDRPEKDKDQDYLKNRPASNFAATSARIRVHRERSANITVANACGFHFSHPQLYTIFKRENDFQDGLLKIGEGPGSLEKHAPSILRRVLGSSLPNTGFHASGIVVPFEVATTTNDNNNSATQQHSIPPQVLPRASAHLMFTASAKVDNMTNPFEVAGGDEDQ
jgi:hypothetical protein